LIYYFQIIVSITKSSTAKLQLKIVLAMHYIHADFHPVMPKYFLAIIAFKFHIRSFKRLAKLVYNI